jgi:hypothetical protein
MLSLQAMDRYSKLDTSIITVNLYHYNSSKLLSYTTQNHCDEQGLKLQKILQSLARRVPQITLQRVEEIFLVW